MKQTKISPERTERDQEELSDIVNSGASIIEPQGE